MMFSQLELSNFRAISGRLKLPLAPLTVVVGENATGKSSLLQSLALLAQSANEEPRLLDVVAQGSKWTGTTVRDLYFRHDESLPLEISIHSEISPTWWLANAMPVAAPWNGTGVWPPRDFTYSFVRQGSGPTAWSHRFLLDQRPIFTIDSHLTKEEWGWDTNTRAAILDKHGNMLGDLRLLRSIDRVLPEQVFNHPGNVFQRAVTAPDSLDPKSTKAAVIASYNEVIDRAALEAAKVLKPLTDELRGDLGRVFLIEPLRGKEVVVAETGVASSVGRHGENLLRLLTTLQVRRERPFQRLREWAVRFGIQTFESGLHGNQLDLNAVDSTGNTVGLQELATGSFQGLLLAAQIVLAGPQSTLLIEEPEANMHPAYERELAGLLAQGVELGHQLIVTTHSEILVAAVANLVRSGKLSHTSVRIVEMSRRDGSVAANPLPLTERGLAEWVHSFTRVESELSNEWASGIPEE